MAGEMEPSLPRCVATADLKKGGLGLMDNRFKSIQQDGK